MPTLSPQVLIELTTSGFAEIASYQTQMMGREVSLLKITPDGLRYVEAMFPSAAETAVDDTTAKPGRDDPLI